MASSSAFWTRLHGCPSNLSQEERATVKPDSHLTSVRRSCQKGPRADMRRRARAAAVTGTPTAVAAAQAGYLQQPATAQKAHPVGSRPRRRNGRQPTPAKLAEGLAPTPRRSAGGQGDPGRQRRLTDRPRTAPCASRNPCQRRGITLCRGWLVERGAPGLVLDSSVVRVRLARGGGLAGSDIIDAMAGQS